jgi:hypothetical protein
MFSAFGAAHGEPLAHRSRLVESQEAMPRVSARGIASNLLLSFAAEPEAHRKCAAEGASRRFFLQS